MKIGFDVIKMWEIEKVDSLLVNPVCLIFRCHMGCSVDTSFGQLLGVLKVYYTAVTYGNVTQHAINRAGERLKGRMSKQRAEQLVYH